MAQVKRRYTRAGDGTNWIITAGYDERKLDSAAWFEAQVSAVNEATEEKYAFPREIRTYRIGEIEHSFREYVLTDWDGDREAAVDHLLDSMYRRVYDFIERGH